MKEEYLFWRLVIEKAATKEELNREYTYTDMMKLSAGLDIKSKLMAISMEVPKKD